MEIVVDDKNYEELNKIRINIVESILKTNIEFSSYKRIGTNSQILVIDPEEPIKEEKKKEIIKIINNINYKCKFLFSGFETPIVQLKAMNKCYNKIQNFHNVYYYLPDDFTEELIEFAHEFVKNFRYNFQSVKPHKEEIDVTLGLSSLGIVPSTLINYNGRLYLEIDGKKYLKDYTTLSEFIKEKMENSDLECHYDIENNLDVVNLERLKQGISPLLPYYSEKDANMDRFRLSIAFAKLCKTENLPMLNCKDIVSFTNDVLGFEYYTLKIGQKIEETYDELNMDNYKEHEFTSLEDALAFTIYLSGFSIKHYLMINKVLKTYVVSYVYVDILEPYQNIDDMKMRLIKYYKSVTSMSIDTKELKNRSLVELIDSVIVRDHIIFHKRHPVHISPYDKTPLPLYYYDIRGYQKYSLYNIGNVITGIFKRPPMFDREDLSIRDVVINIIDGDVYVHGVKVAEDMYFLNNEKMIKHILNIWKKGYLLTSYGLMYYIQTGKILKHAIKAPEWFTLKGSNKTDFYKFIKFNGF